MERAFTTSGGMGGRVDAVCHMAARAGVRPSLTCPEDYIRVNITGTTVLLDFAAQVLIWCKRARP